ncbi:MAG: RnfABCDGE type electron transport complex subunit B [Peptostreptococcaceae bacterium]|nr:RnfABCDGE type electron transport complex subunit B [Peptostreptococcaceae bacterium]
MSLIVNSVAVLSGMGLIFGAGLAFASQKFAVEVDPKVEAINNALPGANCGGCGLPGCSALAQAIVEGKAPVNACPVGGSDCASQIASIMGVEAEAGEKKVARVICNGTCSSAKEKAEYVGIKDCKAAMLVASGSKSCTYGCLGLGTCVSACAFGAIDIVDGVAVIDKDKCVSCGKCTDVCPKNVIDMVPYSKEVVVECNSLDFGKAVKDKCAVGCIGCGMCVRECPFDAIIFENKIAKIDYEKCKQCYKCVVKCPTGAISGNPEKIEKVKKAQEAKKAREAAKKKEEALKKAAQAENKEEK